MKDPDPRVESRRIDEFESEFPQCDPRYAGQSYRDASNTVTSTEDATFLFEDIPAGRYRGGVFSYCAPAAVSLDIRCGDKALRRNLVANI
jgi:hypothetical protein